MRIPSAAVVPMRAWLAASVFVILLLSAAHRAAAHDPGLSSASFTLDGTRLDAVVTLHATDLEPLFKAHGWSGDDLPAQVRAIGNLLLEVQADDRVLSAEQADLRRGEEQDIALHFSYPGVRGAHLKIRAKALGEMPFGHRQLAEVRTAQGKVLASRLLSAGQDALAVDLRSDSNASAPAPQRFGQFFLLGIEHIITGYDHLLFLFALLLVCASFRSAALVITCFTVAHSLTLGLATFDLVRVPASVVEPTIAITIIYVGIENILRRDGLRGRWLLTGVFGLVHGLGFAGVLRELGIGSGGSDVIMPLFSFNLGVEAGQLAIAALVLPALLAARRHPAFAARWVPACSVLVCLAGAWWLIERTLLG
jgi:hydrogenase/urease accessory protein HupE